MALPLIPIVLWGVTALTTGGGAVGFASGRADKNRARQLTDELDTRRNSLIRRQCLFNDALAALQNSHVVLKDRVRKQGDTLERLARATNITRNVTYNKNGRARVNWRQPKDNAHSVESIPRAREARDLAFAAFGAASLRQAGYQAVRMTAQASTGTALRTLSGEAARRGTIAAAGGGAKAAGGLGMAGGMAALNGVAIGGTIAWYGIKYKKAQQANLRAVEEEASRLKPTLQKSEKELAAAQHILEQQQRAFSTLTRDANALDQCIEDIRTADACDRELLLCIAIEDFRTLCSGVWG